MECLHQCRRCGIVYDCSSEKCGLPFGSGHCKVCSSPAVTNFMAMAN
jgi:hypothetical protein